MKELKEDETDRSDDANPWGANDLVLAPEDRRDFEDAFTNTKAPFERLPDSAEYLAGLEAKLSRVQQKGSLVRDLQKRREDEVRRFMTGNAGIQVDFEVWGHSSGCYILQSLVHPKRYLSTKMKHRE